MYLYISGTENSRLLLSRNHPSEVRYSPDIFWNMHCTLECRIPGLCEVQISVTPEPVRIRLPSAEISAEKSFLQTHSDNQKYQNDQPYEISIQFKISCMYHGKYIPGTCSLCFTVYTAIAHKYDDCQDHVFRYTSLSAIRSGICTGFFFIFCRSVCIMHSLHRQDFQMRRQIHRRIFRKQQYIHTPQ